MSDGLDIGAIVDRAPSVAGSAASAELPKDAFFDKYNNAGKKPDLVGPPFPSGLANFINP